MKYDREEAYLREKLTDGLHPADVDLWPAVAEHLPDARPARHWRRLCICLAAPLLIAAGVLAGTCRYGSWAIVPGYFINRAFYFCKAKK